MCALLAPIIKPGYNLFSHGSSSSTIQKSKHCGARPIASSASTSGVAERKNTLDQLIDRFRRQRTKSESAPQINSITTSVSTPEISSPTITRRSKSMAGPPPVDLYKRPRGLSTSQYYLQQRRELAKQQQARRELALQQQQQQQQQQQKYHRSGTEKMTAGKADKYRC